MAQYLLVLGDREALGWVLRNGRMAFPPTPRREVDSLRNGDQLFIYTTRSCFRNPTRDRGRVIGLAVAAEAVHSLPEPIELARRVFSRGCSIDLKCLVPLGRGAELAPLVGDMHAFEALGSAWSVGLRRALVSLDEHDAAELSHALHRSRHDSDDFDEVIPQYTRWWDLRTGALQAD